MEDVLIPIAEIYVPAKRKHDIDPDKVEEIAGSILEEDADEFGAILKHSFMCNKPVAVLADAGFWKGY